MTGKPATTEYIHAEELQVLNWLENNGYPFAKISLDSINIKEGAISALLNIEKGPLYKIDSIHIIGQAKISVEFLERYLGIPEGSIYKKDRLLSSAGASGNFPLFRKKDPGASICWERAPF